MNLSPKAFPGKVSRSPGSKDDPPDSLYYAKATICLLEMSYESLDRHHERALKQLEDARKHKIWMALGFPDLPALLESKGLPSEEKIRAKCGVARKIEAARGVLEAETAKPGRPNNGEENPSIGKVLSGGGNAKSYLLRRLARLDAKNGTDFVGGYEREEHRSVRAAAISAGIVKVPTPLEVVKKAIAKFGPEDREELIRWLDEEARP